MQPQPKEQNRSSGFYLYSFAPTSGVGFYLTRDAVYKFDIVTEENSSLEGAALVAQRAEFDQVNVEAYFPNYEELLSFAKTEYLRDKKNTLYSLLLTQDLEEELTVKTLQILDDPEFREVEFSERAVPIFNETANAGRVTLVVQLARELGLKNVQDCLSNELQEVTFGSVLRMMDDLWRIPSFQERPSFVEQGLTLLASCVSLARRVPDFALERIMTVCNYAEQNVSSLSLRGVKALRSVLARFERESPAVNYALAVTSGQPSLIHATYTAALFNVEPEAFRTLSSRLGELDLPRDEKLTAVGERFLDADIWWRIFPPPYYPVPTAIRAGGTESELESARSATREVMASYAGRTVFNRTRPNLQFTLDFVVPGKLFGETAEITERHLDATSFWIAFYANPSLALKRLYRYSVWPFWFIDDVLDNMQYQLRREASSHQELFHNYFVVNMLSIPFVDSGDFDARELGEYTVSRLDIVLRFNDMFNDVFEEFSAKFELPHLGHVLLGNILAWAVQTRRDELVSKIINHLRRYAETERLRLSPFLKFII